MNRKEFLTYFWNKVFKPILFLIAGAYCIYFLYRAIFVSGEEQNFLILITILAFIYTLLYSIGRLFENVMERAMRNIPVSQKKLLKLLFQIISPAILLFLIYASWNHDKVGTLILLAVLLVENLVQSSAQRPD